MIILNCLLATEAILSTYQTWFTTNVELAALAGDNIVECISWERPSNDVNPPLPFPYPDPSLSWESVKFNFPVDAKALFLISRGSLSSGIVRVHQSSEVKDLRVNVFAHYHDRKALSTAKVCLVMRENEGNGVAILTPFRWLPPRRKDSLFFVVDVTFPSPEQGRPPRHFPTFAVDTPEFELDVNDLSSFRFDAFTLKSTNRPITVTVSSFNIIIIHKSQLFIFMALPHIRPRTDNYAAFNQSVVGDSIIVEGQNGEIGGSFNATAFLKLSTTNGPINVSLDANNTAPSKPTVVSLKSTNGPLNSTISLSTNSSTGTGGYFRVYAHTTNAPLTLSFSKKTAPPDSRLVLDATTENAPTHVSLYPAFEGGFLLQTTRFRPTLLYEEGDGGIIKDPAGRGRERNVNVRVVAGRAIIGNVSWVVPSGEHVQEGANSSAGWVSVFTRNAPATLVL
ncbi:hypothetical protein B0F90DRAFT_180798 [Multifurca ochricompacta]|uniref:Uncharacterized protein n=1 Tax=Multifurca ochricompacta TaxID=376703 RepID=A0AAD4M666_9AGAM|nr:hypothetical protein B0F90DRAFT_180798 [Multifurca ochricompacta]